GGIPDIVCLDTAGIPLIVGEVKTWWVHDLKEEWRSGMELRHALGQIANYMFHGRVRYGFLTTYRNTIFLKQEPDR
ncbi:hypothetical protein V8E54_002782, partial [Elaphomyces granulatus]